MRCLHPLLVLLLLAGSVVAQDPGGGWQQDDLGALGFFEMENAPFPHESRAGGHTYREQHFPADAHYSDSTVALFLPAGYEPGPKVDLLFYFHGWGNNVRQSLGQFRLREQVLASGKNVILVFPQGPKDASDSTLGKLEEEGGLARLAEEALATLRDGGMVPAGAALGRVVLSGHSGAYRGIAHGLHHGGLDEHITDVLLLDASYANLDWIAGWHIADPENRRLLSVFTDHLAPENTRLMAMLSSAGLPFLVRSDDGASPERDLLGAARAFFLHTDQRDHNGAVELLEPFLASTTLASRR